MEAVWQQGEAAVVGLQRSSRFRGVMQSTDARRGHAWSLSVASGLCLMGGMTRTWVTRVQWCWQARVARAVGGDRAAARGGWQGRR